MWPDQTADFTICIVMQHYEMGASSYFLHTCIIQTVTCSPVVILCSCTYFVFITSVIWVVKFGKGHQQSEIFKVLKMGASSQWIHRTVCSYATLRRWRTDPHRFAARHSFGAHRAALQVYHHFFRLREYCSTLYTGLVTLRSANLSSAIFLGNPLKVLMPKRIYSKLSIIRPGCSRLLEFEIEIVLVF